MTTTSLHPDVLDLVELSPVEDILLAVLRPALTSVSVTTLVEEGIEFPAVIVRTIGSWGSWGADPRFTDTTSVEVHVFCDGVNADEDCSLLSDAVRVVLRDAVNTVVEGRGWLTEATMIDRFKRVADWATATGPVQYADLPSGVVRWQATYHIEMRKAKPRLFPLD